MGEAKRRGTFAARKAESIARQKIKEAEFKRIRKQAERSTPQSIGLVAFLAASINRR